MVEDLRVLDHAGFFFTRVKLVRPHVPAIGVAAPKVSLADLRNRVSPRRERDEVHTGKRMMYRT